MHLIWPSVTSLGDHRRHVAQPLGLPLLALPVIYKAVYIGPATRKSETCPWASKARVVLDCMEVSVSTPKCLRSNISMYSYCKKYHTIKYMVGASTGEIITFLSRGYGSRASDKATFIKEKLWASWHRMSASWFTKAFWLKAAANPPTSLSSGLLYYESKANTQSKMP